MPEPLSRCISLQELIQKSDLIVVAHKEDSSVFSEERYIISYKKSPPFTSRYYLFSFSEIIYSRYPFRTTTQKVNIYCADDTVHYKQYEKFIHEGSKTPIETDYYQSGMKFEHNTDFVLFLKNEQRQGKYSFTVNEAFESISRLSEIKGMLKDQ